MALPKDFSEKAQLLAFVLAPGGEWAPDLVAELEACFGQVLHLGKLFPFDGTGYYGREMGGGLFRGLVSFAALVEPEKIALEKARSNSLEAKLSKAGRRKVNVDVGYMDLDKVVLPSFKRGPFKLYAGGGVWLDMQLTYAKGRFHPTAWAFPDFKAGLYGRDLLLVREKFKKKLRAAPNS